MKVADIVASLLWAALGIYALVVAAGFPEDVIMKVGPAFMPMVLAGGLVACSVLLLVLALTGRSKGVAEPLRLADKGTQRALAGLVVSLLYAFAFQVLGFHLATMLFVAAMMLIMGKRQPFQLLWVSALTAFAVHWAFLHLLNIEFPLGLLEGLI